MLIDSKAGQFEQMQDQQKICEELKDFDKAWHEILYRDYQNKTLIDKMKQEAKCSEGKAVQEYLKQQMLDKIERERIHQEINEQKKQIAREAEELAQQKLDEIRNDFKKRQIMKDEILMQIYQNREMKKHQLERELKIDQIFNEQIQHELEKEVEARKAEEAHFQREVNHYLDYLRQQRQRLDLEEKEKEKLIEDVRKKKCDDEWIKRCQSYKQRLAINEDARKGQRHQIFTQEKLKQDEAIKEKHFNCSFNDREMKEREKLKEEKWQHRLKAFRYGQELMEQQKLEELKRKAEKQKLEEELMLIEKERQRCEEMGKEFVKSSQDVLPLHPNLRIILKGKKY